MTRPLQLTRRAALSAIAVTAAGGALMSRAAFAEEAGSSGSALIIGADVCVITPEVTEGPYYFDPALERSDITEGRPGAPTTVRLQVVDAMCQPIEGARVDIWHADASGLYSGYSQPGGVDTRGETFMRGTQFADANGVVEFQTVYPGWYRGRTTHIHFKVFTSKTTEVTGQVFFDDALSEKIYRTAAPYNERGAERDTVNSNDNIAQQAGAASVASVEPASGGYLATLIISIA